MNMLQVIEEENAKIRYWECLVKLILDATGPLQIYKRKRTNDWCIIAGSVEKRGKRFYNSDLLTALQDAREWNGGKL